ncbi:MAG: hypothetical protein MJ154_03030 [Candidatus Saccharibacteria bacterium]|nr:hypothetical protein [Candidatus Saccharibacteria bacterium]
MNVFSNNIVLISVALAAAVYFLIQTIVLIFVCRSYNKKLKGYFVSVRTRGTHDDDLELLD